MDQIWFLQHFAYGNGKEKKKSGWGKIIKN